ncbi:MAG: hypothetical protein K2J16_02560 [Clostridia bacterium]|nr:hypothetical protein [Clostridia bacterium]
MKIIKLTCSDGAKILVNVDRVVSVESCQKIGVNVPYRSEVTFSVSVDKKGNVERAGVDVKESLAEIERLIREVDKCQQDCTLKSSRTRRSSKPSSK